MKSRGSFRFFEELSRDPITFPSKTLGHFRILFWPFRLIKLCDVCAARICCQFHNLLDAPKLKQNIRLRMRL